MYKSIVGNQKAGTKLSADNDIRDILEAITDDITKLKRGR
jgi:hypothetical protein